MSEQPGVEHHFTRRDAARLTLAGLAGPLFGGFGGAGTTSAEAVRLGMQTAFFRDLPRKPGRDAIDQVIEGMTECGARECELFAPLVEPYGDHRDRSRSAMSPQMMRREQRKWRLRTPLAYFAAIGDRFKKAGIAIYAYNYVPDATFSDEEIDRGFSMARALGAQIITASVSLAVAKRLARFADQHKMVVALGDKSRSNDRDAIATPADLASALTMSKYFRMDADVGPSTPGTVDPVALIRDHRAEIACVHLTGCRVNGGTVASGLGETPIGDVLQLLQRERWPIHVLMAFDHRDRAVTLDEVKRCFAYAKQVLA